MKYKLYRKDFEIYNNCIYILPAIHVNINNHIYIDNNFSIDFNFLIFHGRLLFMKT